VQIAKRAPTLCAERKPFPICAYLQGDKYGKIAKYFSYIRGASLRVACNQDWEESGVRESSSSL